MPSEPRGQHAPASAEFLSHPSREGRLLHFQGVGAAILYQPPERLTYGTPAPPVMAGLDPIGIRISRRDGKFVSGTEPQRPLLCVMAGLGPATHGLRCDMRQSRGWPAGACPRAGLWPDPWAGHDTIFSRRPLILMRMGSSPAMTLRGQARTIPSRRAGQPAGAELAITAWEAWFSPRCFLCCLPASLCQRAPPRRWNGICRH